MHAIVSRDEWLAARRLLLAREKELTAQRDLVSAERRRLPWVPVDKAYVFDGPNGPESLAGLFEGRSQLIVYHFMFGPDWKEGCPSCSFLADHVDGTLPHLAARGIALAVVSRAPLAKLAAFRQRMGWRFKWVSSSGSDFNYDYHVSFTPEALAGGKVAYNYRMEDVGDMQDLHGISVFARDGQGNVFHTYSSYARGADSLVGSYHYMDLTPKGRDEDGLPFPMAWVRHHDKYPLAEPAAQAVPACCHAEAGSAA
nr:thioredoxin family protein [Polaromonas sp. CF318]